MVILKSFKHYYRIFVMIPFRLFNRSIASKNSQISIIKEYANEFFNSFLYSSIPAVFILPQTVSMIESCFNCRYNCNSSYDSECLTYLSRNDLNGFFKLYKGSIYYSMQYFWDLELFFPPSLRRCHAGNMLYLDGSKIYCCPHEKPYQSLSSISEPTKLANFIDQRI